MNRRSFFRTAALSAAALTTAREGGAVEADVARTSGPTELDLATAHGKALLNANCDVFVRLEELYPADPGQLSGVGLRITDAGRCLVLQAEIGGEFSHCFGYLNSADAKRLATPDGGSVLTAELREMYSYAAPDAWSGAQITRFGIYSQELQVRFGSHCLGVLRGRLAEALLDCIRGRIAE